MSKMRKKIDKNKKAVSPQLATVLLIAFVIAIVILIILWGKHYIEERAAKQGKLAEKQLECESVQITIVKATRTAGVLTIGIKNMRDIDIEKFTFRIIGENTEVVENRIKLRGLEIKEYNVGFTEDIVREVDKVDIIPWLKVATGYYVPCSTKHVTVNL